MLTATDPIPVVLFAYARPRHLRRVLACLRSERVPLLYVFADGAKGTDDSIEVAEARRMLREIDWCEIERAERPQNLGLGRNVLAGVAEVAERHEAFIVWEDDLICAPGTYAWLCAALRHYASDTRVMSVSAWTHPTVTPLAVEEEPYFDGRAECWVWGSYRRCWPGMERTALEKIHALGKAGRRADEYGADLPKAAQAELRKNVWAVRWLYHHMEQGKLCVRPPWSMVEHIGFDAHATNAISPDRWASGPLRPAPPIPAAWPAPVEDAECRRLWQRACPAEGGLARVRRKLASLARRALGAGRSAGLRLLPESIRSQLRQRAGWRWFRGDYSTWAEARAASGGYEDGAIVAQVLSAAIKVRQGQAAYERDSVLCYEPQPDEPLLAALEEVSRATGEKLRVLDFGGSLGSSYGRLLSSTPASREWAWDVVEQPAFVEAGRRHLTRGGLRFFFDVREAEAAGRHDVLLCSGVLQYLEEPARMLAEWRDLTIPYLLLYNLPLHSGAPDRLRVQHVPPRIYPASYPVRFFNREAFLARLAPDYEVVREFPAEAVWVVDQGMYPSTGLLLKRKRHP